MKTSLCAAIILGASILAISHSNLSAEVPSSGTVIMSAQDSTAKKARTINGRQRNQQKRIKEGVQSGELTNKEATQLEKGEGKIRAEEIKDRADGKVTPKERVDLQKDLNKESKAIHHQKHDPQERKHPVKSPGA
ncbi:MAG: hypothetical protein JWQ98_178 [Chlorobi bacterium]|nr:hypothetical protein [Chlorobiota bacterium]